MRAAYLLSAYSYTSGRYHEVCPTIRMAVADG
jgi:hypothetical protein